MCFYVIALWSCILLIFMLNYCSYIGFTLKLNMISLVIYIYICVCVCIYIYIYIYVCVCVCIYIYIYINLKKLIWVVAWFYFMISIRYLITIMDVQTFESEQKFNVSLQNHIEPQASIIVTTSIAYKSYHLYSFIQ